MAVSRIIDASANDPAQGHVILRVEIALRAAEGYSALSTDIGVSRTALHAGTSVPANTVRRVTPTAVAKVAGSLGATPKSNLFLYHRYERVIFGPVSVSDRYPRHRMSFVRFRRRRPPATPAIGFFIGATLTRSPLHQGIFVIIAACGAGLVLNSFLSHWHSRAVSNADDPLIATVIWAAFALVFAMNVASRAALVLPLELPYLRVSVLILVRDLRDLRHSGRSDDHTSAAHPVERFLFRPRSARRARASAG